MDAQRVSQLEAKIHSFSVRQETMMKEMREMFLNINSRFDQLVGDQGHRHEQGATQRNGEDSKLIIAKSTEEIIQFWK
ncbi:unnamed protein product, partial [Ilex paraguariensis]